MLNYDTLLSSYDDKLTLMQWLKKVEAALAGAALASVSVEQPTETTAVLTFHFADGTALSSPSLILPQGEQGVSVKSAYIKDGNLHLVLTNGDDLDAGNMFSGDIALSGNLTALRNIYAAGVTAAGVEAQSITANSLTIKADNYIRPAGIEPSEGDITISKDNINDDFREVYSFHYGHWRVSNGKLSIVVCPLFYNAADSEFSHDFSWLGSSNPIILPQSVLDRLYVIVSGGQNIISAGSVETQGIHSNGQAYPFDQLKLMYKIQKLGNGIRVVFDLSKDEPLKIAAGTRYAFRLEENFVL